MSLYAYIHALAMIVAESFISHLSLFIDVLLNKDLLTFNCSKSSLQLLFILANMKIAFIASFNWRKGLGNNRILYISRNLSILYQPVWSNRYCMPAGAIHDFLLAHKLGNAAGFTSIKHDELVLQIIIFLIVERQSLII